LCFDTGSNQKLFGIREDEAETLKKGLSYDGGFLLFYFLSIFIKKKHKKKKKQS